LNLKKLDDKVYNECLEAKIKSQGKIPFWEEKYKKFKDLGYDIKDREDLRDKVRKWCKKRGITVNFENGESHTRLEVKSSPRIAVMDLETLPGIGYFFQLFDTTITVDQIIKDTCMLGWAAKYLNESEIYSDFMTSQEAIHRNTSRIAKSCWDFLSTCDYVIGHNFQSFDSRYINTEFLMHNLPPLKYGIVDTLSVAKQNMRFDSNKLSFINKKLGIREKLSNDGFPMWSASSDGNSEALKNMEDYCRGDITSTEDLFFKLRPYIRNFNVALYNEIDVFQCPVCGSTNLKEEGFYFSNAGKWISARCLDCKCISRKKQNLLSKEKKKSLLVNS